MRYHFHIINGGKGFSAHCLEIEGLRTQGDTWAELENNIREVFELWFSDLNGYEDIPKPLKVLPVQKIKQKDQHEPYRQMGCLQSHVNQSFQIGLFMKL